MYKFVVWNLAPAQRDHAVEYPSNSDLKGIKGVQELQNRHTEQPLVQNQ
jgi:hypothetical protein